MILTAAICMILSTDQHDINRCHLYDYDIKYY